MVHNEPMNIKEWLSALPGSPTVSQAADHAGVSKATFLRHEKKKETTAEYVVKIARAYNVNEVQALIDLGFIDEAAVMELAIENALGFATNSQLWVEQSKRADPEARRLFRGEGVPGVVDLDDEAVGAEVFEFPTPDVEPERYVAKTKKPEPREGDDDYGPGA